MENLFLLPYYDYQYQSYFINSVEAEDLIEAKHLFKADFIVDYGYIFVDNSKITDDFDQFREVLKSTVCELGEIKSYPKESNSYFLPLTDNNKITITSVIAGSDSQAIKFLREKGFNVDYLLESRKSSIYFIEEFVLC